MSLFINHYNNETHKPIGMCFYNGVWWFCFDAKYPLSVVTNKRYLIGKVKPAAIWRTIDNFTPLDEWELFYDNWTRVVI